MRLNALTENKSNGVDQDVRQVLLAIQGYENIPRKRAKFINFCKNAMRNKFHPATIEKTWEVFESILKGPKVDSTNNTEKKNGADSASEKENGDDAKGKKPKNDEDGRDGIAPFKGTKNETEKEGKKKKKRKALEEQSMEVDEDIKPSNKKAKISDNDDADEPVDQTKFDWIQTMSDVLQKKGPTKANKLKKKVVNEFVKKNPETSKSRVELEKKFEKKLGKCKKFKLLNEVVQFSTSRDE